MNVYAPMILKKRKEVGITQAEFASSLHYSVQTAAKYETGVSEMDVVSLVVAARVLGVDVDSFIHGVDAKKNDLADKKDFNPELFAKNIAVARIARRMSQKNLAAAADCSTRSIKNYEAGNSVPSLTTFRLICDALNVKAHEFIFEDLSKKSEFYVSVKNKRIWVATGTVIAAILLSAALLTAGGFMSAKNHRGASPTLVSPNNGKVADGEEAPFKSGEEELAQDIVYTVDL